MFLMLECAHTVDQQAEATALANAQMVRARTVERFALLAFFFESHLNMN